MCECEFTILLVEANKKIHRFLFLSCNKNEIVLRFSLVEYGSDDRIFSSRFDDSFFSHFIFDGFDFV